MSHTTVYIFFNWKAVHFLHESGILLHYPEKALNLNNLYFIDPGWLCCMMAQVVTVKQINPFIRNGVGFYSVWKLISFQLFALELLIASHLDSIVGFTFNIFILDLICDQR